MRVTFLAHSGFLVELSTVYLLFDWWKGTLPPLSEKPLLCFASHRHPDHFDSHIFALDDGSRPTAFVLSKDIPLTRRKREQWNVSEETLEKCVILGGNAQAELPFGASVETLPSTDEGVAFLVSCDGVTVYHAGDLNWWHWEGEDKAWNRNMEVNFKRYIEPLRGRRIDLAFAPLDKRLGAAADWGLRWLLELAEIRTLLPMHQWGDGELQARFPAEYPAWADVFVPVEREGRQWTF